MASFSTRTHFHDGKDYVMRVKHGDKSFEEWYQVVPDVEDVKMHQWYSCPGMAAIAYEKVLKARVE